MCCRATELQGPDVPPQLFPAVLTTAVFLVVPHLLSASFQITHTVTSFSCSLAVEIFSFSSNIFLCNFLIWQVIKEDVLTSQCAGAELIKPTYAIRRIKNSKAALLLVSVVVPNSTSKRLEFSNTCPAD